MNRDEFGKAHIVTGKRYFIHKKGAKSRPKRTGPYLFACLGLIDASRLEFWEFWPQHGASKLTLNNDIEKLKSVFETMVSIDVYLEQQNQANQSEPAQLYPQTIDVEAVPVDDE